MSGLYLIAHVAGRMLAIDADSVESVVDLAEVVPVPRAGPAIRGIAALRSRVVTVIDTRVALGLPGSADMRRAVIVPVDGQAYALLVDALDDIAAFELQPLAGGLRLDPAWQRIARGVITREGEPVLAVDFAAIVPSLADAA